MENDFPPELGNLCRFCLRIQVNLNMFDLFDTGTYNTLAAVTGLKLSLNDGMPKNVCLECKLQTEEVHRFICLIKSSEESLLSLLNFEKVKSDRSNAHFKSSEHGNGEKEKEKEKEKESEDLFLIVVPESNVTQTDHTYPKGKAQLRLKSKSESDCESYSCDRCKRFFSDVSNFLNHFYECRIAESEIPNENFFLNCPICCCYIVDERHYDKHLQTHKNEGINIFKLNRVAAEQKAFKINLNGRKCKICQEVLESEKKYYRHCKESHRSVFRKGAKPKVVYECPVCSHRLTDDRKGFLRHLSSHLKENIRFVKVAVSGNPVPVTRRETVFLPTSEARKEEGRAECESLVFTPEANFQVVEKNNYVCEFCSETFATKAQVSKHLKEHLRLTAKEYFCGGCGKKFSTETGLARHKKIHSAMANESKKCKICHRSYSEERSLERHSAAHSDPNFLECEICKLPVPSASRLERHSETHLENRSTWECDVCGSGFLSKDGLACHRSRTGHVGDRKPLECNVCHEKFQIVKNFARHVKLHPKYKTTECSLCGKRLSTLQSLSLHMKRHFESDGILCPECGKRFFEERNYRRHLLIHKGIRPYLCDYQGCGKSFYTLFEIKRHKKYHFDTRDFPCPFCSKKFHESNHLKVHVRTHTGEKPYVCPHCRKGFVTRTRCKQHIKLIHRGMGYDLIVSDITKKVPVFETLQSTTS